MGSVIPQLLLKTLVRMADGSNVSATLARPCPSEPAPSVQQSAPDPGWYPDPAGSAGVRWWDGYGWTEHLALPDDGSGGGEQGAGGAEADNVVYLDVARTERPVLADDGLLHPRSRDVAFAGAPRGPIDSIDERMRIDARLVQGLVGAQVFGAAAVVLLCAYLVVSGLIGDRSGYLIGAAAFVGLLTPRLLQAVRIHDARSRFWLQWSATRGFEPGIVSGVGSIVPKGLDRSPLFGPLEQRIVEHASRRLLAGNREAVAGSLLRIVAHTPAEGEQPAHTPRTPALWRSAFVIMPLPELHAGRWPGASIRADHAAKRPPVMRALLGPLVASSVPDAAAHLAAAPGQDPRWIQHLGDARLELLLSERPVDVDIVNGMLIVMSDGMPSECNQMDELCRTALTIHELLVPEHEVPAVTEVRNEARPADDEPVIDVTREGWGESAALQDAA